MSIHTREEPYIYDFIIVSLIKNPVHKKKNCKTYWLKFSIFVTENSWPKDIAN